MRALALLVAMIALGVTAGDLVSLTGDGRVVVRVQPAQGAVCVSSWAGGRWNNGSGSIDASAVIYGSCAAAPLPAGQRLLGAVSSAQAARGSSTPPWAVVGALGGTPDAAV